jgi:transcriptional regulator with XRE-family HTH domain
MTGEELHILRRRRKMSQARLGEIVGLTREHISRLETGVSRILPRHEEQFRRALDPEYEPRELARFSS